MLWGVTSFHTTGLPLWNIIFLSRRVRFRRKELAKDRREREMIFLTPKNAGTAWSTVLPAGKKELWKVAIDLSWKYRLTQKVKSHLGKPKKLYFATHTCACAHPPAHHGLGSQQAKPGRTLLTPAPAAFCTLLSRFLQACLPLLGKTAVERRFQWRWPRIRASMW